MIIYANFDAIMIIYANFFFFFDDMRILIVM